MLNIKLIYKSLLDNHIKLMRQISFILILFAYFTISTVIIVLLTPESSEKASFVAFLNSLGVYLWLIFLLLAILSVLFPDDRKEQNKNYLSNRQMFFIIYFPVLPMFISSIGFAVIFIGILLKNLFLIGIGQITFLIGLLLALIMWYMKSNIERQIYYSITEAHKSLITIDKNNSYQVNRFIKFIKLTYDNLNIKLGRKLKINTSELGIFHIKTILNDILPYYIKLGDETQLESLRRHIETMSKSVDETGYINLRVFNNELIQLGNEVIEFLKDNDLKIVHRFTIWNFFKNIENIKNVGTILFYLIMLSLMIMNYFEYGKLPEAIIR